MIIGKNVETKKNIKIDLNTLIRTRGLIQASSGGGKSWIIRRLLEQTHGKVQQIVIDLDGEFESLREQYDYLLVAKNGDVPADIKTAGLMAKRLLELGVSAIVDISELKHHERILYVKRFLDALLNAPKRLWHPVLVIVDEAHQFCPQGAKSDSANSVIDLMTRGRKRGFCGILATQRISKLNKDASAEGRNRFIGLAVQDIDRKRASEELGFTSKEDEISLRKLDDGEFFLFGPAISKEVIKVKVGGVNTTHPDVSKEDLKLEPTKTPSAITKILKDVADIEKEAEEELRTVQDYKKRVATIQRENTLLKKQKPIIKTEGDGKQLKIIESNYQKSLKEAEIKFKKSFINIGAGFKKKITELDFFYRKGVKQMQNETHKLRQYIIKIHESSKTLAENIPVSPFAEMDIKEFMKKDDFVFPIIEMKTINLPNISVPEKAVQNRRSVPDKLTKSSPLDLNQLQMSDTNGLSLCARKIYSFLFNNSDRDFSRIQLATITGYSHRSGGFKDAISRLNVLGLVKKNGMLVSVNELDPALATEDMSQLSIESWMGRLNKCARMILQMLLDNPSVLYTREEIADQTGYSQTSGGFKDAISKLNVLGLLVKEGTDIKLNPEVLEL